MVEDLYLVMLLVFTIYIVFMAAICAWLAGQKHRDPVGWGILGFLFGILALIALGLSPVRITSAGEVNEGESVRGKSADETPTLDDQLKKCPACAEMIKLEALKCRYCQHEFDADRVAEEVRRWQDEQAAADSRHEDEKLGAFAYEAGSLSREIESGNTEKTIRMITLYRSACPGALARAIRSRQIDVVRVLLELSNIQKALNLSIMYEGTPLHIAVKARDIDIVRVLVECGADVNKQSVCGQTPLHLAEQLGNQDIVQYLQGLGAKSIAPLSRRLFGATARLFKRKTDETTPTNLTASVDPDMIHYPCPTCGIVLAISREYAGLKGKCWKCGSSFKEPQNSNADLRSV